MSGGRVLWVDTARGLAIIAVVMFHAAIFLDVSDSAWRWTGVMSFLQTFRMPLFFFAAGLFGAKILTQSPGGLWRGRLALLLYLYVLWSAVRWVFFQFVPFVLPGTDAGDWRELLAIFVWPASGLWFLYALILYSLFVWGCRRLPPAVPLAVSGVVSLLFTSDIVRIPNDSWMKVGSYVVFFVGAVYLRRAVLPIADRITTWQALAPVVAYLALAGAYQILDLEGVVGLRLLVSVAGVTAGVALSVLLTRSPLFGWVRWLGARTLPVYLVHYLPIAAVAAVLVGAGVSLTPPVGAVAVPVLAAGAIVVSLAVERALRPVRGVFDLPGRRRRDVAVG